jgi:hypothetical protein
MTSLRDESAERPNLHPQAEDDLLAILRGLIDDPAHDYNTSAEALRDGTIAAFNYLAHRLGNSGFQASWAILNVLGDVNGYEGPFGVVKADEMLYPQYQTAEQKAREMSAGWKDWLRERATERLAEYEADPTYTHLDDDGVERAYPKVAPTVIEHWRMLANV